MPSYLEIALRAAVPIETQDEQKQVRLEPNRLRLASKPIAERREGSASAPCGLSDCAGCYEVAPGVRIHPPKCGEKYREWLEGWDAKARLQ